MKIIVAATAALLMTSAVSAPALAATISTIGVSENNVYQVQFFNPGQSFTAIDNRLISIGFNFEPINPSFPQTPITLQVFEGEGTSGALLASRTFDLGAGDGVTDIDFTGVQLTIGSIYSAVLSASSPYQGVWVSTVNPYAEGRAFSPNFQASQVGTDLAFRVIGTTVAGVPEPTTWAMLIGGIGLAGGSLRRRKANVAVRFA